jgi:hypothetical protein
MKKILTLIIAAGMFAFTACGPSAEEKAAAEKARMDSIAAVEAQQRMQDSIATIEAQHKAEMDSIAQVQKAQQDSVNAAMKEKMDKMEKKMNNKPKTTDPTKVKPGQGKG